VTHDPFPPTSGVATGKRSPMLPDSPMPERTELSRIDFDFLRRIVLDESAIVLDLEKAYMVETRLLGMVRRERFPSLAAMLAAARNRSDLRIRLIEGMTTNETSFFRDIHPFEVLRTDIIPERIAARGADRQLNIWCAACSSGQEPYSLAILLREHFPELVRDWTVRILATDLSGEMVQRAASGRFSQLEINRGLPVRHLVKYFSKDGEEWSIRDDVRSMIEFRPLNLIGAWANVPALDIVLLRNVLIYFELETRRQILSRMRRLFRPGGWLLLGSAETTMGVDDTFARDSLGKVPVFRPTLN